jgi:very-short-patch-repair endonuclease
MSEAVLRRFARDQWVRLHGTPRVTVLVGGAHAGPAWLQWLSVGGLVGTLLHTELDVAVPEAVSRAVASPTTPIAVACAPAALHAWRAGRSDRLAAMVDEGVVAIPDELGLDPARQAPVRGRRLRVARRSPFDARSAAEAALFEALEATRATAGRFELNGCLSVRFGSNAAEVDLLSREDRIAIEIDGYHHFGDLDAYRRDRRKDLLLQTQGLLVIRVLAEDVMRDPRPAITEVCRAIAARMPGHR